MNSRVASLLLCICLVAISLPALAKIPPFALDVEPDRPVAGEPVTVTVELTQSISVGDLGGLIALFRAEDAESRARGVSVPLQRVGETTYEAVVVLPEAGEWRMVSFPDRTGWSTDEAPAGYPDQILVEVVAEGGAEPSASVVAFAVLIGAAALISRRFFGSVPTRNSASDIS
jgi:hypothetical protein